MPEANNGINEADAELLELTERAAMLAGAQPEPARRAALIAVAEYLEANARNVRGLAAFAQGRTRQRDLAAARDLSRRAEKLRGMLL